MNTRLRWAWVVLFLLLAAAAINVNMHSRRILVVHEGISSSHSAKAFTHTLDDLLQTQPRLKLRHQYLSFDPHLCHSVAMQLQAFDPATVIAEGQTALQCLNSLKRKAGTELISIPDIPVQNPERLQYVQAWTRLLLDLSPAGTTLLAFSGSGLQAQAEMQALGEAAYAAQLVLEVWPDTVVWDESQLASLMNGASPSLVVASYTAGWSGPDHPQQGRSVLVSQSQWMHNLRTHSRAPIVTARLENLLQGADMALAHAPEQRAELLAQRVLSSEYQPAPPYEMAVGMTQNFFRQRRSELPPFYEVSARMAGLLLESAAPAETDSSH